MFEDFFRVDSPSRMQTHYLIEKVYKLSITDPFVTTEIEPFLKDLHQAVKTLSEQLVLLGHYLGVITAGDPEQAHIDLTVAIERQHTTLQTEPQWEAREYLKQNAPQRPYIEDERDLGEILHAHVGLLGEALSQE